ncbi:MAG: bifunctional diaminohydroxyphosphoribosylaminopyrimidine deaminase/5-amino-6-(5-phosphoribosylamino)uracil reductase RibD [Phycisphaerae bacterium]|nr:bifunctional diaminohydroxyphosphoribosylaminopyrimidine deaminase/5-amino-6-(5-phosphoribosylamino)uracil reductase RibD [Phycisphaerae bacterium]
MQLALRLAAKGRGKVEPNPMVGALLIRDGQVISQGYHERFGAAHAEINALGNCQGSPAGATMYVTLEPCCHQGKTPACTEALIRAGLAEVVVAAKDPSEKVAGKGLTQLRQAGIKVTLGPAGAAARRLNAAFFKLHRKGRPFVLLKWAQSLDGKIATRRGESRWISNEESRRFVHRLRRQSQAILVGIGTALADDPLLTPRPAIRGRLSLRIVVDSRLRLPIGSQLARTAGKAPLLIATTERALQTNKDAAAALQDAGAELCCVNAGPGQVDLAKLLDILGQREILNLMVEGGSQILTEFLAHNLADEICAFVCPLLIGSAEAPGPFAGVGPDDISQALKLQNISSRRFANDLLIRGDLPGLDYLYE